MDVDLGFVKNVTLTGHLRLHDLFEPRPRAAPEQRHIRLRLKCRVQSAKNRDNSVFYNYLVNKAHLLTQIPCKDRRLPQDQKTLPKYLTLDESVQLLQSVDGQNRERDYCILTIFLNCGLRISGFAALTFAGHSGRRTARARQRQQGAHRSFKRCLQRTRSMVICRPPPISGRDQCLPSSANERISRSSVHALVKSTRSAAGLDASEYSSHKLPPASLHPAGHPDAKKVPGGRFHPALRSGRVHRRRHGAGRQASR